MHNKFMHNKFGYGEGSGKTVHHQQTKTCNQSYYKQQSQKTRSF